MTWPVLLSGGQLQRVLRDHRVLRDQRVLRADRIWDVLLMTTPRA